MADLPAVAARHAAGHICARQAVHTRQIYRHAMRAWFQRHTAAQPIPLAVHLEIAYTMCLNR